MGLAKAFANPIMVVGDNPVLRGGLSRSGRDIATLIAELPRFRVAYLGRGIGQRREFPFLIYDFPESGQWGEDYIEGYWKNFSCGEEGIILTTDDVSRRHWFANPIGLPDSLQEFLGPNRNFRKWGYFPLDSAGPGLGCLPTAGVDTIRNYDRVLGTSEWSTRIFRASGVESEWLPHGIWPEKFHPVEGAREMLGWKSPEIHVGCVAANQERKDFPCLFQVFRQLQDHYGERFRGWLHTNCPINSWNIWALAADYGVTQLDVTYEMTDDELAVWYSGCHATLLPSGGEGFGYPIAESLSCGTPCVVTGYAGGAELVSPACRIEPLGYHCLTPYNCLRAINSPGDFTHALIQEIDSKQDDWDRSSGDAVRQAEDLQWPRLRKRWEDWLERGLSC